ncbi:hypothetical protein IV102_09285 [bacterium]|nr:hypothetical protein [bacterium]
MSQVDPDTQFAQATLNLLRHVTMSAPVPVIQALKDQLEERYQQLLEPLHPGVDFLVRASLEGEFEAVLPMVQGMLHMGAAPSTQAIEESFASSPPAIQLKRPATQSISQFKGAGKAYRNFFSQS